MLDIKAIREDPERFRAGLARRDLAEAVDRLLELDERRRALTTQVDELRADQNRLSKAIGGAAGDEKQELIGQVAQTSASLKDLEPQLTEAEDALTALLAATPNVPHESAPDGFTDEDAVEVKRVGAPPTFDVRTDATTSRWASCWACSTPNGERAPAAPGSSTCWATSCSCSSRSCGMRWTCS